MKKLVIKLCYFLSLLFFTSISIQCAFALVDESWDWSDDNHTAVVCFDSAVNDTWKEAVRDAMENWNSQGTSWTLQEGTENCEVTIEVGDIDGKSGGAYTTGFGGADANGRISSLRIRFDPTPAEGWTWGSTGNTLDRELVAKHELTHTLRLDHPTETRDSGNISDPVGPGNHNTTPSQEDKDELADAETEPIEIKTASACPLGATIVAEGATVVIPPDALAYETTITVRPTSPISTPSVFNVPSGVERIVDGVDIRCGVSSLSIPATVTVSYREESVAFYGVDESSLESYVFNEPTSQWELLPGSEVDTEGNTVTFQTSEFSFFGIGGPPVQVTSTTTTTTELTTTTTTIICPSEAIYGKYSEETELLRDFRDNVLSQTPEGQEIIKLYYEWNPVIVEVMEKDEAFKEDVKEMIDRVLGLIEEEVE